MVNVQKQDTIEQHLSHSAHALLQVLADLQSEIDAGIFQPGPDVEILEKYIATYKGNLYEATLKNIDELLGLGEIETVSQDALLALIERIWKEKASTLNSTQSQTLSGLMKYPGLSIKELSRNLDLSYGQTRRAVEQLHSTSILRVKSILNIIKFGLDRVLIDLVEPETILVSPYITRYLFVDGPRRHVFLTALFPSSYRDHVMRIIRTLRRDAESVTAWRLSSGKPEYSAKYYHQEEKEWNVNELHFKLLLRSDHELAMAEVPVVSKLAFPPKLNEVEERIVNNLLEDYNASARELADITGASESMVYRCRNELQSQQFILPRVYVSIPVLTDRILATCDPSISAKVINAWRKLPLTCIHQISNMENHNERKVLLTAALPAGGAEIIIDTLISEKLLVNSFGLYKIDAGHSSSFNFSNRYNSLAGDWNWDSDDIDITSYHAVRGNSDSHNIPLDLA